MSEFIRNNHEKDNSKTLTIAYNITKQEFPKVISFVLIGIVVGTFIITFGRSINPTFAMGFLSTIAQISATLLGIFYAAFLFLIGLNKEDIRNVMDKGDFIASFLLFTIAIVHSLISILVMEPDQPIALGTPLGSFMILAPLFWMIAAILMIGIFLWHLFIRRA